MSEQLALVKRWLDLAEGDYESAKHLLTLYPLRLEVICYLCEQTAEKLLKGFLCTHDEEPPRTHDLMKLCRQCADFDDTLIGLMEPCANLTPYGVQVRYPNNIELIEEDMRLALKDIQLVFECLYPKIKLCMEQEPPTQPEMTMKF